jgi:CHAT domain-containing protein
MIQSGQMSEANQLCQKLLNEPLLPYAKADLLALAAKIAAVNHDNSKAISNLEQAIEFTKAVGESRVLAEWESSLSSMYVAAGDLPKAEQLARGAVKSVETRGTIAFLPERLNSLAQVLVSRRKYTEAREVYDRAALIQDTMIGKADSVLTKTALITKAGSLYANHFALIADHFRSPVGAYNVVERARGRAIADLLVSGPTTSEKGLATERQISRLRLALMAARSTNQIRAIRDQIFLAEQYRSVNRGVTILNSKNFEPVDVQRVQRGLAKSEVILEYVLAEPTSYCSVITSSSHRIVRLADKHSIEVLVRKYLATIKDKKPTETDESIALYKTVLKPIEETKLKSRFIIVADGDLHLLPFDALVDDRDHHAVVQSKTVVYTPSATSFYLLRSTHRPQVKPVALLALGGVPYGGSGLQQSAITRGYTPDTLWDLPGSLEEVAAAGRALPDPANTILTDRKATETAFKRAASGHYRVIHLAVHGFPNADPDRASLVMLSDPVDGDDGFLEASEIVQLHINADLVVLSACDTGVGPDQGEEGISSLSTAFLLAGAGTVVSTLWAVEDAPSLALIKRFYQFLRQGQSPSESMANAKRAILNEFGPKAVPAQWAGFIVEGSDAPPSERIVVERKRK